MKGHKRISKIHHMWVECTELNGYMWLRIVSGVGIDFVKAAINIWFPL